MIKTLVRSLCLSLLVFLGSLSARTVDYYLNELKNLSESQSGFLVLAYLYGKEYGLELTLASIVWKESSFGKFLINKSDGLYGSFGLCQILLTSGAKRNKVNLNNSKEKEEFVLKLITDHKFNLKQAVNELLYWKSVYKDKYKYKYWYVRMVASYNDGWRSSDSKKGYRYFKDIQTRNKALIIYMKNPKYWSKFVRKYLLSPEKSSRK